MSLKNPKVGEKILVVKLNPVESFGGNPNDEFLAQRRLGAAGVLMEPVWGTSYQWIVQHSDDGNLAVYNIEEMEQIGELPVGIRAEVNFDSQGCPYVVMTAPLVPNPEGGRKGFLYHRVGSSEVTIGSNYGAWASAPIKGSDSLRRIRDFMVEVCKAEGIE